MNDQYFAIEFVYQSNRFVILPKRERGREKNQQDWDLSSRALMTKKDTVPAEAAQLVDFTNMFTNRFYACRSQKGKKSSDFINVFLPFGDLHF